MTLMSSNAVSGQLTYANSLRPSGERAYVDAFDHQHRRVPCSSYLYKMCCKMFPIVECKDRDNRREFKNYGQSLRKRSSSVFCVLIYSNRGEWLGRAATLFD